MSVIHASPTNFERTWKNVTYVYKELGLLATPARFDEVMDFSIIQKLARENAFSDLDYVDKTGFVPSSYKKFAGEKPILTQTIRINFYPNSTNLFEPQHDAQDKSVPNTLYDPNVMSTLERVARLAGQYERASIAIVGHTDSSMKGVVDRAMVDSLSKERANAVKAALVKKYDFSPNKFVVEGKAWDEPADSSDPLNQALNRRVEIAVFTPEK